MPGEFTRRAFENGRIDLTEAEGLADLLEAETEAQRRAALAAAGGAIRRRVEEWQHRLVTLSAMAEAAIDYVGDEDEVGDADRQIVHNATTLKAEMSEWLAQPRAEPLKEGIRVVLAGPPNAGKSSLLNALIGEDRAIVTAMPGTTRDVIEVPLSLDGSPFVFVDTAGLRDAADLIERMGIERAEEQTRRADLVLWLGAPAAAPAGSRLIQIHAKADLAASESVEGALSVSSHTGEGLSSLKNALVAVAREILPAGDRAALNQRQAQALTLAVQALGEVAPDDIVLKAEALRHARHALDQLTGRAGIEDVLDELFGRFCLGK